MFVYAAEEALVEVRCVGERRAGLYACTARTPVAPSLRFVSFLVGCPTTDGAGMGRYRFIHGTRGAAGGALDAYVHTHRHDTFGRTKGEVKAGADGAMAFVNVDPMAALDAAVAAAAARQAVNGP